MKKLFLLMLLVPQLYAMDHAQALLSADRLGATKTVDSSGDDDVPPPYRVATQRKKSQSRAGFRHKLVLLSGLLAVSTGANLLSNGFQLANSSPYTDSHPIAPNATESEQCKYEYQTWTMPKRGRINRPAHCIGSEYQCEMKVESCYHEAKRPWFVPSVLGTLFSAAGLVSSAVLGCCVNCDVADEERELNRLFEATDQ